ncbi:cytochrome c oxidase assembly protein [Nonomuraea turcica]|uniref:cytochrome c oxidase assembly protein n=1 Tax=Nonomuraea sp. G32 TaxID=3067274 RepID=UPI00273BA61E|nr:cytochrome c oxidase assembly protein [Nonomuraea sp. G32]MDP4501827.1 cytochrome c oxidase assembly protein [Nonomuraea sp. G32]
MTAAASTGCALAWIGGLFALAAVLLTGVDVASVSVRRGAPGTARRMFDTGDHASAGTQALFVLAGTLLFWVVVGSDPIPRSVRWPTRVAMLAIAAVAHLILCVFLLRLRHRGRRAGRAAPAVPSAW